jgi:hypothetical protein
MMWNTRRLAGAAASVACLTLAAAPVAAFDLNGTWAGKITCKGVFNGAPQTLSLTPTLFIDDLGTSLALAADGIHYTAVPYPSPGHPEKGEIALIRCDTSSTVSGGEFGGEFGRLKVGTKQGKGTGSLGGTSFRASVLIASSLSTCHWAFKRVTVSRPALDGCPAPPPPQ